MPEQKNSQNIILSILILIFSLGIIFIRYVFEGQYHLYYVLSVTTFLIFAYAIKRRKVSDKKSYSMGVIVGLGFSIFADACMVSSNYFGIFFLFGLSLFLCAHICYVVAFWRAPYFKAIDLVPLILMVGYGVVVFFVLQPGLGDMMVPVIFYIAVICTMGWRALSAIFRDNYTKNQKYCIVFGASFFMLSDTILALNRFLDPIPYSSMWVLSTYLTAQYLIASSIPPAQDG